MSGAALEYLLVRAAQEHAHAEQAFNELVKEIHLKLAREYESRAHVLKLTPGASNVFGDTARD